MARLGWRQARNLGPGAIAALYRALRKGREDAKDEPGAADIYYGEMEMRRHTSGPANGRESASRGQVDRAVLTVYWLISGYGLRAWRAFTWLAAVIALFGLAFHRDRAARGDQYHHRPTAHRGHHDPAGRHQQVRGRRCGAATWMDRLGPSGSYLKRLPGALVHRDRRCPPRASGCISLGHPVPALVGCQQRFRWIPGPCAGRCLGGGRSWR